MNYIYKTVMGNREIEVDEQLYNILDALDREERNAHRKYYRHNPIYLGSADCIEEWMDESSDILSNLIQEEDREQLYKALEQLNFGQQRLIELVYFFNEKIVDIAQEFGVSQQAISKRLMKAREKLKKLLSIGLYF